MPKPSSGPSGPIPGSLPYLRPALTLTVNPALGVGVEEVCIQMYYLCRQLNLKHVECDGNERHYVAYLDGTGIDYSKYPDKYPGVNKWTVTEMMELLTKRRRGE